jgi:hypothetical protein
VIAYSGTTGSSGSRALCFVTVGAAGPGGCKTDSKLIVDRPAWSTDGRTILAIARDPASPNQTELVAYTSPIANSPRPADWVQLPSLATDALRQPGRYVLFTAFSPDGKQAAVVANWSSPDPNFFQVFLSPWTGSGLGPPAALSPQLRACEVAWRPDSAELVVMSSHNCGSPAGDIQRVDPTKPAAVTTLRSQDGRDPEWEPVALSG